MGCELTRPITDALLVAPSDLARATGLRSRTVGEVGV